MIAFSTLLVLLLGYGLYAFTLGQLTDFPQLAESLKNPMPLDGSQELTKPSVRESEVAAVRGFGPSCKQVSSLMTLKVGRRFDGKTPPGRGVGTYIYIDTYEIAKGNARQLLLKPFSLVHISHSENGSAEGDEILTAQAKSAVLEFDRDIDITKPNDLEPLSGWIQGEVTLKSNRKTVDPSDDIVLFTEKLHYDRDRRLIWADDQVKITVEQQGTITGKGVEVELYPADSAGGAPADGAPAANQSRSAEAKVAKLLQDVRFELLLSAQENFLGSGPAGPSPNGRADEKSSVVITARGPFIYDLEKTTASFTNLVRVLRRAPSEVAGASASVDQLEADKLLLQFGKNVAATSAPASATDPAKTEPVKATPAKGAGELKIEHVVATGSKVILLSEAQKLEAVGNYLQFDAADKRVTLRGEQEMIAVQNNAVIHARSLLIEQDEKSSPKRIVAEGPQGFMELNEESKEGSKESPGEPKARPLEIRWQERLVMDKKPEIDNFAFQITGNVEVQHDQWALTCQKLKGLLVPVEGATAVEEKGPESSSADAGRRRRLEPIKLEAEGAVSFHSPQAVCVSETLLMDILNRRVPPPARVLAATESPAPSSPASGAANVPSTLIPKKEDVPAAPTPGGPADQPVIAQQPGTDVAEPVAAVSPKPPEGRAPLAGAVAGPGSNGPGEAANAGPPVSIEARMVALVVERVGSESRPVSAWAEGSVKVSQPPKNPGDRPLEVIGNQLEFQRHAEGDVISIRGTEESYAEIRMSDQILAAKHRILLNEAANKVEIGGPGYLTMQTSNSLSGQSSTQPMPIRVDWQELMNFDGKIAYFEGKVIAKQENNEIHSRTMEVTFDQKINFRARRNPSGDGSGSKPSIENVFCEGSVEAYSREMKDQVLLRQSRLMSDQIRFDNVEGTVSIDGQGSVTIVEPNRPKKKDSGPPALPFRVTFVEFADRLTGGQASQTVKFFGNVNILHLPVADPSQEIDRDALPPEGFEIVARSAEMSQSQEAKGQKFRLFSARDNVKVRSKDYSATCGRVSFDEQKSLLVFEGEQDRPAYFRKEGKPGQNSPTIAARTIRLNQETGEIQTDGSEGFNAMDLGGPGAKRTSSRR
jgi:lipopolysaccharide export system protein LptA